MIRYFTMMEKREKTSLTTFDDFSHTWQDIWLNVVGQTQQTLMTFWKESPPEPPAPSPSMAIFDPDVMGEVFAKACLHLAEKPERLWEIQQQHLKDVHSIWHNAMAKAQGQSPEPLIEVDPKDKRFQNPLWQENPVFYFIQQVYLLNSRLLRDVMANVEGIDPKTNHKLEFYTRHLIDALAPTNFPLTNPDVLEETFQRKGENLIQGFKNYLRDTVNGQVQVRMTDMEAFTLGQDIAATPGKVVYRNDLFELIYYTPTTRKVMATPLLILPPWINKYYIFDLKPENSFVRWAVAQGIPVFIVSWVNPDERHAHKTLSDYVLEGARTAMDQVLKITRKERLNMMGYCTGGILLNCLLTYLKAKNNNPVKSATVVATPVDFREAGDLLVYVCEQQLKKLKAHVRKRGFLEGQAMVQSFNLLRANDLIWSFYVNNYLMGKDPLPFDMLHWNCDAVRMPATMHTDYLRWMYLENRLMQPGGISIGDVPVDLKTIDIPMFIMAAIDDHIAPWRSVYPLTQYPQGETRFVLSGSGHVAGVFNHPDKKKYHHWFSTILPHSADEWLANAEKREGSWWPLWLDWLKQFSDGSESPKKVDQSIIIEDAPGSYVKMTGE